MQIRADELVRAVMDQLKASGPTELAVKLDLPHAGPKRIGRWLKGANEPDFEGTIALLLAAGWIKETQLYAALERLSAKQAQDLAGETAASVSRLGERGSARPRRARRQGS